MTSDQIFDVIFGRLGKGRFNLNRTTCSFAREFADFKVCTQTTAQGKRKTKIRHIKVNPQRKEKSLLCYHVDIHSILLAVRPKQSERLNQKDKVKRIETNKNKIK